MKRILLAVVLFLGWASTAGACSVDIDTVTANQWIGGHARGYDVFEPATFYQPLTLNIRAVDGACPFYVSVAPAVGTGTEGVLAGPVGASLRYVVYRDASGSQALSAAPGATEAEVLSGTLGTEKSSMFQVSYTVIPQQVVPPGDYSGQIAVTFYEGKPGGGIVRAQQQVPLTVHVAAVTDISFSQGPFDEYMTSYDLAFGRLHEGDIKGLNLRARGNAGYRILLRSENGGAMQSVDPSDDSSVPYTLSIDGRSMSLGKNDAQAILSQTETGASGKPYRLEFNIDSLSDASAGDYKDTIWITVLSLK